MTAGSDDDWAPLPADAQCAHPGELAMLGKREPSAAPPQPAVAAAPKVAVAPLPPTPPVAEPAPEDPAVLKALAALRAKIASAPAPTSMVAEVQERLRRAERRQQRRQQAPPADLQSAVVRVAADEATADGSVGAATNGIVVGGPVVAVGPTPSPTAMKETPPTPPVVGAGDSTAERTGELPTELAVERDEREDSEWYLQLPAAEQQRLHKVWAEKRASAARAASNVRRNGNGRLVAGILVFVAVMLLGTRVNWHATLGAGVVCGIWWRHARADRFLDPLRAFASMAVLQVLAMLVNGASSPQFVFDAPLLVAFSALVGFDGEMRRTGGFDVR